MALALLDFQSADPHVVRLAIDTGSNLYYRYKIGQGISTRDGIDWVDGVTYSSPMLRRPGGPDDLLRSASELDVPAGRFSRDNCYVQLFSFRNEQGLAPAFSKVLMIPVGLQQGAPPPFSQGVAGTGSMTGVAGTGSMTGGGVAAGVAGGSPGLNSPRQVPNIVRPSSLSAAASAEGLLARYVELAMPVMLNGYEPAHHRGFFRGYGSPEIAPGSLYNMLHRLLFRMNAIPAGMRPDRMMTRRLGSGGVDVDFSGEEQPAEEDWVIFLPCLVNAANECRMRGKQLDEAGDKGVVPNGGAKVEEPINGVTGAGEKTTGGTAAGAAVAKSLGFGGTWSLAAESAATPSAKVLLTFEPVGKINWNGEEKVVYSHQSAITVQVRINTVGDAPTQALPRAIFTFTIRDSHQQALHFEKVEKRKDITPGSLQPFTFTAAETAGLPEGSPLQLFAEIRWLASDGRQELNAVGSTEIILAGSYFIREQGKPVSPPFELSDMTRFRPFWNKIWEAPVIDTAGMQDRSNRKYGWEIDVNGKYFFMLTAAHDSNGLMETRLLAGPGDPDGVKVSVQGRMKAGIEISIRELNKLLPAIDGRPELDPEKLEAFVQESFARAHCSEFVYHFRLKGKAGVRGMIWVVPVMQTFEFRIGRVGAADADGLVTQVTEETVRFPLPVAARSIGLTSE